MGEGGQSDGTHNNQPKQQQENVGERERALPRVKAGNLTTTAAKGAHHRGGHNWECIAHPMPCKGVMILGRIGTPRHVARDDDGQTAGVEPHDIAADGKRNN